MWKYRYMIPVVAMPQHYGIVQDPVLEKFTEEDIESVSDEECKKLMIKINEIIEGPEKRRKLVKQINKKIRAAGMK